MPAFPHVYFGGRWVTRESAVVPIGSLALRYGLSAFEGIRLYVRDGAPPGVRPFLLDEHRHRLARSLRLTRLPDPGVADLPAIVSELVERNSIGQDAYVRAAVTPVEAGDLGDPARTVLTVTAAPMGRKVWLAEDRGMSLAVSDWQRAPDAAFPSSAKNISNYAGPRVAWLAAREAGFDGCVLVNADERLCEAPTAALFLVHGGELLTPALSEGVLPGITRRFLLDAAAELGLPARECRLSRDDARTADEAFLCGTGIEIASVRAFDGHRCRAWPDRPITRRLVRHYFSAVRSATAAPAAAARGLEEAAG